jgi:transcriptional regulator with XRE-family HTH domain
MENDVTLDHEETFDYEELKGKAHELAKDGPTYEEIAEKIGVSRSAVAQAVTTAGPKFHRLQIRIVELLSDLEVEEAFVIRSRD